MSEHFILGLIVGLVASNAIVLWTLAHRTRNHQRDLELILRALTYITPPRSEEVDR